MLYWKSRNCGEITTTAQLHATQRRNLYSATGQVCGTTMEIEVSLLLPAGVTHTGAEDAPR